MGELNACQEFITLPGLCNDRDPDDDDGLNHDDYHAHHDDDDDNGSEYGVKNSRASRAFDSKALSAVKLRICDHDDIITAPTSTRPPETKQPSRPPRKPSRQITPSPPRKPPSPATISGSSRVNLAPPILATLLFNFKRL